MAQIVRLQLRLVEKRLAAQGITLAVSEKAIDHLAHTGYDPVYGARPLKRLIQKELVDVLALHLLDGEFADGDTVMCDVTGGRLTFETSDVAVGELVD